MNRPQRAHHIEALLPPGAVAFEMRGGASPDLLFAAERDCVSRAVGRRVREFAAGRLCARAGLVELGFEEVALPSRRDRVPQWPADAVGCITHTEDYCLAVIGLRSRFAAMGVDAERIGAVDPEVWRLTMSAEELSVLADMDDASRRRIATVNFSAKEAFYKCQYALTQRWLGFEDAVAHIREETFSIFVAEPSHPVRRFGDVHEGRFCICGPLVITAMALSADSVSRIRLEESTTRSTTSLRATHP